jgi:hypothetical protein
MKRLFLLLVLLPLLSAGPALAVVPSTMSYQGVLMDNAGVLLPDGNYGLTFRLYTVASGGVAIWTETQSPVALSRGGFSVILGSVASLGGLAFDVPYWLGITVGGGGELSPRVALASSPYGLSLRLPFAGAVSSAGAALAITNPGIGPAITADPLLTVGTPASDGHVRVYENGVVGAEIGNWGDGGYLHMADASAAWTIRLEPDIDGGGAGFFLVQGGPGSFTVNGNDGTGSASVSIVGAGSASYFSTSVSGDAAVQLPGSSVSAGEILDEPGIAQNHYYGSAYFYTGTSSASVDILSVSITIPAAGYIVLTADAQIGLFTPGGYAGMQITDVSGAPEDYAHYFFVGGPAASGGVTVTAGYVPVSMHRTYYESAAGTYTFYFQGWNHANANAVYAWDPTLTALYAPTAYGSVTTSVTAAELPRFEQVTQTSSAGNGPGEPVVSGVLVDLRELELRDAEARAQAERAHRRLVEAQLARQLARTTTPAAKRP